MMNQVEHELMHFGILGMHWGKHKATMGNKPAKRPGNGPVTGPRAWGREAINVGVNTLKHPVLTANASISSQATGSTKSVLRRNLGYQKTSELRDINARTKVLLATKKMDKKTVNKSSIRAGKALVAGMLLGNLANVAVTAVTKKAVAGKIAERAVAAVGSVEVYKKLNR
jgi:hypothetical protein